MFLANRITLKASNISFRCEQFISIHYTLQISVIIIHCHTKTLCTFTVMKGFIFVKFTDSSIKISKHLREIGVILFKKLDSSLRNKIIVLKSTISTVTLLYKSLLSCWYFQKLSFHYSRVRAKDETMFRSHYTALGGS